VRTLTIITLLAAPVLAADPRPNMKPGQWETTVQMEMPGMPVAMPPTTTSSCLTEKDLVPNAAPPGQECKVTKQKFVGDNVEWSVECKDKSGAVSTMTGKGTYKGETFAGTMQMTMNQGGGPMQMNAKMTGKRVGDCKKP
jgi:hypothetical protein